MTEPTCRQPRNVFRPIGLRALLALLLAPLVLPGLGCENDSWLYDPSIVGRWEHTPTVVPILERIDVIERDQGDFLETSEIMPEDLIPVVKDYEIAPGDTVNIEIFDFLQPNVATPFQRVVDGRGFIDLPQLGRINVLGLTAEELRERIRLELREQDIIRDALVSVQVAAQRQLTFSVFGFISGPGRYFIPRPDYRLLEALTEAGGLPAAVGEVFVIRQTPLTDATRRGVGIERATPPPMPEGEDRREPEQQGRDLNELIDELTEPPGGGGDGFGAFSQQDTSGQPARRDQQQDQDQSPEEEPPPPAIDLIDEPGQAPLPEPAGAERRAAPGDGRWMFLNGEWVRVQRRTLTPAERGLPEGPDALGDGLRAEDLVTQRVIRVPAEPLLKGLGEYNIVIRPGDVIRVPDPEQGVIYMGGPGVAGPGTYNLPQFGRLTLTRAVMAAGGLSAVGVPWRVDLTRMVGEDRQATIRLNLKAIFAGSQPDVFMKPNDVVNIGTAFWATPLAVIRNGFRMSYGFGFLLDRNFGNDVFGAPPSNFNN